MRKEKSECDKRQIKLLYYDKPDFEVLILDMFIDKDSRDLRKHKDFVKSIKTKNSEKVNRIVIKNNI